MLNEEFRFMNESIEKGISNYEQEYRKENFEQK